MSEKLPDLHQCVSVSDESPWLVIETQGAGGLRYLDHRESNTWQKMPAWNVPVVRDAGGSGDWCTAGFLHRFAQEGYEAAKQSPPATLRRALTYGQALGAWNCAFLGARGGVYQVGAIAFDEAIARILAGETIDPSSGTSDSTLDEAGAFCPHCK